MEYMSIASFNKFFERFALFQLKHRVAFVALLIIFTIISTAGLVHLEINYDEDTWFDDWERVKQNQDHFEEIFGSEDSILVLIKAKDVFDPKILDVIDRLGDRLLMEVPYADSVTSLMELSVPIGTEEGFEVINPFEDGIPTDLSELEEKKNFILSRESLVNSLVSADATETWLIVKLEQYSETLDKAMMKITPPAMAIINSDEFKSDEYELLPAGLSYTEYEEREVSIHQSTTRIATGFIVMVLCLIIFIRSLRGIIVPALATVCALTSVLGITGWMGIAASSVMLAVVVLISMALSVGYTVHYVNSFRMHFRRSGKRMESVVSAVKDTGWSLLFTVITTVGGMLSFLAGGIRPMRWVGAVTAVAVFAVYVYVMILLPILLSYGKDREVRPEDLEVKGATKMDLATERFGHTILVHKKLVLIIGLLITLLMIPGILLVEVNMNFKDMMGDKIPYVKRLLEITDSQLGSQYSYDILIEYSEEDALKRPEVLKNMDELTDRIGTLSMTKISNGKPRVSSVTKIVKEMNRTLNGDDAAYYTIPDDQDLVTQIMFLYEISGGRELYDYISEDFSTAYLHVELKDYRAKQCEQNMQSVEAWLDELFPDATNKGVVGKVMQFSVMNGKLVRGSLKSIGVSMIVILLMLYFAFSSMKTALIAMIPNIAPIVLIGGVMGYFNLSLDLITALIMPMILGISVDDTIHFTNHIKYHEEVGLSYDDSITTSFREIGKTMIMTTLILCALFVVMASSEMAGMARIGYLSIIGLAGALIADYTLTPVLLLITKPFGKGKTK